MRASFAHLEPHRLQDTLYASPFGAHYGAFMLRNGEFMLLLIVDAGDMTDWEHVSVSARRLHRQQFKPCLPTWEQMCFVKDLFWEPEECVVQFHPPRSEYVNQCSYCLHLWRPRKVDLPRPGSSLVGWQGPMPLGVHPAAP